ncbi:hypothetical protein [Streptomyces sp. NPDC002746]
MPGLHMIFIIVGLWTVLSAGAGFLLGAAIRTSHRRPDAAEAAPAPAVPADLSA